MDFERGCAECGQAVRNFAPVVPSSSFSPARRPGFLKPVHPIRPLAMRFPSLFPLFQRELLLLLGTEMDGIKEIFLAAVSLCLPGLSAPEKVISAGHPARDFRSAYNLPGCKGNNL
jgi:hypothetical protein